MCGEGVAWDLAFGDAVGQWEWGVGVQEGVGSSEWDGAIYFADVPILVRCGGDGEQEGGNGNVESGEGAGDGLGADVGEVGAAAAGGHFVQM